MFEKDYEFTANWFQPHLPQWLDLIDEFQGKPVHLLEIGSYEGRSAVWLLEYVCIHPDCKLTTIDCFEDSPFTETGKIESRFRSNIALTGKVDQVEIIKGKSFNSLIGWNNMEINSKSRPAFDFVYIDGSHVADDVLLDITLVWPLLKTNGIIIFDDYRLQQYTEPYNNPKLAIDAFVAAHEWEIKILDKNYQLALRKVENDRPFTIIQHTVTEEKSEVIEKLEPIN